MEKKYKLNYDPPRVTMVSFVVEEGLQMSVRTDGFELPLSIMLHGMALHRIQNPIALAMPDGTTVTLRVPMSSAQVHGIKQFITLTSNHLFRTRITQI